MGEAKRKLTATKKLIEEFPNCCLCGGIRPSKTRDHIPAKTLFDNKYRPDDLVVPACEKCNNQSSTADLVVSIISRWGENYKSPSSVDSRRLIGRLRKQEPEIIEEWLESRNDQNSAREHLQSQGVIFPADSHFVTIGPQTTRLLNLSAYKMTLALYFAKIGHGLPAKGLLSAYWRTKEDTQIGAIPSDLLDLLPKHGLLEQGKWDSRKDFEYRFDVNIQEGILGFVARLRRGLYLAGFAISDGSLIPKEEQNDWISPSKVSTILNDPAFLERQ